MEDGDITISITQSGTVDISTPGIYTITYTVTDSDNNTSTITRTVVVVANNYTVHFFDHDTAFISSGSVSHGGDAVVPTSPTRTGYTFSGWTGGTLTSITADTDFTAQYTINQYTLTFNSDGGTAVVAITGDYNTAITPPTSPTKTGYTFTGWSPALPATMLASNKMVVAQWTPIMYQVSYDANG